jgi:hypothetical protein
MSLEKIGVVVGIVGAVAAISQATGWKPTLFWQPNARFSCQHRGYPNENSQLYTVMYNNGITEQPWLRMVNTFGKDWDTLKRCDEIAQRLENFRKDGLLELTYRNDPKTPNQAVICAKTKISGDNCEILVTLKPGANGYESLSRAIEALKTGNSVDQNSNGKSSAPILSPSSPSVSVVNLLAKEDLKASLTPTK